jgi:hypothetical protein
VVAVKETEQVKQQRTADLAAAALAALDLEQAFLGKETTVEMDSQRTQTLAAVAAVKAL